MSATPQRDDQVLLAKYIRERWDEEGYFSTFPSDRMIQRYIDDYTSEHDLQKARDELEPILPLLRQMIQTINLGADISTVRIAESVVDRILASLKHMGFAP